MINSLSFSDGHLQENKAGFKTTVQPETFVALHVVIISSSVDLANALQYCFYNSDTNEQL